MAKGVAHSRSLLWLSEVWMREREPDVRSCFLASRAERHVYGIRCQYVSTRCEDYIARVEVYIRGLGWLLSLQDRLFRGTFLLQPCAPEHARVSIGRSGLSFIHCSTRPNRQLRSSFGEPFCTKCHRRHYADIVTRISSISSAHLSQMVWPTRRTHLALALEHVVQERTATRGAVLSFCIGSIGECNLGIV